MHTLSPGHVTIADGCNVHALIDGAHALIFDFGRGKIVPALRKMGVQTVDAILLTHPHADQIAIQPPKKIPIYASSESKPHLTPEGVKKMKARPLASPVPENYRPHTLGLTNLHCTLDPGRGFLWRRRVIRVVPTPGHTKAAITFLVDWNGRTLAFCGDAVHAPGLIWEPHNLEWDHWSTEGGRAALWGLDRLGSIAIDALFPSHGKAEFHSPLRVLNAARKNLQRWITLRENIAPRTRVPWLAGEERSKGLTTFLPHLHRFGGNGVLLASENGDALIWDLMAHEVEKLPAALKELGLERLDAASATHYHFDHAGGLEAIRKRMKARIILPKGLAPILAHPERFELPFLPDCLTEPPDKILCPNQVWRWNEYEIETWFFPGQTREHYAFAFVVDGQRVLLSGDNFFPPDRWGGSGGCGRYNQSRPRYFSESARKVLASKPNILFAGHQATFGFSAPYFRKVITWAQFYESACRQLGYTPEGQRRNPRISKKTPEIENMTDFPTRS